jgi:hypothetical protein
MSGTHLQRQTEASKLLWAARKHSRLELREIAAGLKVNPRTFTRWASGCSRPSTKSWVKITVFFAPYVPEIALQLAQAANVPSPFPSPVAVDHRRIEDAILHAADLLDISPRRVRAVVRNLAEAVGAANGTLADLVQAAQEKTIVSDEAWGASVASSTQSA